jgi:MFS family permease
MNMESARHAGDHSAPKEGYRVRRVAAGSLADWAGRKRTLLAGLAVFAADSAWAASR